MKAKALAQLGAEVLELPVQGGLVDLEELLRTLGKREVTSILVEGGGTLLSSLFEQELVDEVLAFIAPIIIGGKEAKSPVEGRGIDKVAQAFHLSRVKVERFSEDVLISGYIERRAKFWG
jgi:diaminohydroxyphosphoribosylaminopyrimidine deaminase/5-amino-6-(5-phosphoribosylamino)uracil reductase